MKTFLLPLLSISAIVIGVFLLRYSYRLSKKIKESLKWPFVNGKILKNDFLEIGPRPHPSYDVDLEYEYSVMSKLYKGNKPHLYTITVKKEAEDIVNKFKAGDKVSVFYDPEEPENSVLVTGPRKDKPYHEYAMSIILILTGFVIAYANLDTFKEAYEILIK